MAGKDTRIIETARTKTKAYILPIKNQLAMKTDNFYYVINEVHGNDSYAYVMTVDGSKNLYAIINDMIDKIDTIQQAKTKKHAQEIADAWNESYLKQGRNYYYNMLRKNTHEKTKSNN